MVHVKVSENGDAELVTPLTDDEIKEFNERVERCRFEYVRNGLKDALDIILITATCFYRQFPSSAGHPALSLDDLIDSITEVVSTAMLRVDDMSDAELEQIAGHTNYVYDAFRLVEPFLPNGVLPRNYQLFRKGIDARGSYLRKVFDIYQIICTPIEQYKGSDVGYSSMLRFKKILADYPGGKTLNLMGTAPDSPGYVVYDNKPLSNVFDFAYQQILAELLQWADNNLDNDDVKYKYCSFLTQHASDISNYVKIKPLHSNVTGKEKEEMYMFFYRWFLKEQASE